MEINEIPDRRFKVLVIKLLIGLEQRGEDLSEILKKKKREKNMKGTNRR